MADKFDTTLTSLLKKAAEKHGDNSALIVAEGGPSVTHAQLQAAIDAAAAQIKRAGVKPGDLVSLAFPNTLEFVVLFLGVVRARAVAAPLNAAYTQDEFKFFMEDAHSKLLLVPAASGNPAAEQAAAALGVPVAGALDWAAQGVVLEPRSGLGLAPEGSQEPGEEPQAADEALFLHTSGTTSRPKGVPLTHGNLAASVLNIIATYELSPADSCYCVMPLFHVHGLMAALLASLAAGGATVLPASGRFSAGSFWGDVAAHGATWYTAVPTIHQILLSRHRSKQPNEPYPALRFVRSCSASLAPAVLEGLEGAFGAPVLEAYAMTEASHQMCANPLPAHGPHKPGTVGKATGIQLAILSEEGEELPSESVGEVCIRGPNVTAGYRGNPAANEAAFAYGASWTPTGEKVSPVEVDAAMLSHPAVAEAVAFGAPDEKYGEEVNAAVVVQAGQELTEEGLKDFLKRQLAAFKIPKRVFFADSVPRTATGKIQRRFVAEHFLQPPPAAAAAADAPPSAPPAAAPLVDGNAMAARALAAAGVRFMFGVVGIPVTQLATEAQKAGIRFIAFRNEQAAGYAAGAAGYLTGVPGALLTVSGPGCVHGLAGLSNGMINTWPLVMVSGSSVQADRGKGDFQELDQLAAVQPFVKSAGQARSVSEIPQLVASQVAAACSGRPGGTYLDLPSDILHETITEDEAQALLAEIWPSVPSWAAEGAQAAGAEAAPAPAAPGHARGEAEQARVDEAFELLRAAKSPLVVVGKGAAYARAEEPLREFVEAARIPFVATPMGKGVLPDAHALSAGAARSLALAAADVVLVVGARLNWMLHFGEAPRWSPSVKFILVEIDEGEVALRKPAVGLVGDARAVMRQLSLKLRALPFSLGQDSPWLTKIQEKVRVNAERMAASLARDVVPLNFQCSLRIIRDAIAAVGSPSPILVSEGANTMDVGRSVLEQTEPRSRLDAGTWGTMGVGMGYAIAAAVTQPERLVVAVEGDSAFGFSGLEVETLVRYKLPVVVIVMNNGGVYGGDRRGAIDLPEAVRNDPPPTSFVPKARYDLLIEAFGGKGYFVHTPEELAEALHEAFSAKKPAVINVTIDPMAGVESGRMTHRN
eukprot:jgi/Mesen1/1217/ME000129S00316